MDVMQNIQMVDLQSQYLRLKNEIDSAITTVLSSAKYINGPEVNQFATNLAQYLKVAHVIPVANGTDALQIALMALGIGPGDEVITPDFTFIATVEAVALLGATPIMIDVKKDDFTLNETQLEALIASRTKAIIPVHLFGQCANMDAISLIAQKHNIAIVEDTAQALGSEFCGNKQSKAGTVGDIGCTSFFPSKNLGCFGDGGALFTNNDLLAEKMRSIANHGSKIKYYHDTIGVNSRLDTVQAAVLDVKLKYLDDFNARRQKAATYYDNAFMNIENIVVPFRNRNSSHIFHQYTIRVLKGNNLELQKFLEKKGIPSMIYYPVPIHRQKAFGDHIVDSRNFPISNALSHEVISLPMHTELSEQQQEYIVRNVISYFRQ
ncbi:MAG: DegT/DnrJ/EryC1/StrS family aminotransferase [Salinivirgaceae bacterium]|nr:DegT/DnrJ/EryC1/StrS family aminotransferase [Salinivirgaceae bacterium]MDY0278954.1 DegT/DnrJ/EryC1/StrS family aminotransferase [Salinivirgaceae bacterium]